MNFNPKLRKLIIDAGELLDWGKVNPDILGSMLQAVANSETRSTLGMHYTSVPNIMKVIKPLFLDELYLEFFAIKDSDLKSFPLKDALIFKEIKNLLIRDFEYNSIQKKVLASIFKDKKKTLVVMDRKRGATTIIDTIKCYCKYRNLSFSINNEKEKHHRSYCNNHCICSSSYSFYLLF